MSRTGRVICCRLEHAGTWPIQCPACKRLHDWPPEPSRIDALEEALARATMKLAEVAGYFGPFEASTRHIYDGLVEATAAARKVLDHPFIEQQLVRNMTPDRNADPKVAR